MSDMVHLLEGYRGETNVERCSVAEAELVAIKEEKKRMEKVFCEMEARATELSKANFKFSNQVYLPFSFSSFYFDY